MKNRNIFRNMMMLAAASVIAVVSCEEPIEPQTETVEPVFPELVKDEAVKAGSHVISPWGPRDFRVGPT